MGKAAVVMLCIQRKSLPSLGTHMLKVCSDGYIDPTVHHRLLEDPLRTDPHTAPRRQVSPRPCWAPGGFPATLATPGSTVNIFKLLQR